ncbi:MOSC domain-containing protein [Roseitranquillus sediminis]|uniref:MOSC domain-containing protein n=1 Tax=Roseitranquillus sediminis TaxID=2809051 RepID=UPI0029CA00D2|nr:MOSC domain-containing protein [Roseitranquillus sediminis]
MARIVWLGTVSDRGASLHSTPARELDATFAGLVGEAHGGAVRPSCSRVLALHPRATPIRNVRQITILSAEELREIARRMGIGEVAPGWLGAQMVVEGLPDFSHLPPSSRLQTLAGTTLVVDMQNRPCHLPVEVIEREAPGSGARFGAAARGRRGVCGWVEREGPLHVGDALRLFLPDQRAWRVGEARADDAVRVDAAS